MPSVTAAGRDLNAKLRRMAAERKSSNSGVIAVDPLLPLPTLLATDAESAVIAWGELNCGMGGESTRLMAKLLLRRSTLICCEDRCMTAGSTPMAEREDTRRPRRGAREEDKDGEEDEEEEEEEEEQEVELEELDAGALELADKPEARVGMICWRRSADEIDLRGEAKEDDLFGDGEIGLSMATSNPELQRDEDRAQNRLSRSSS